MIFSCQNPVKCNPHLMLLIDNTSLSRKVFNKIHGGVCCFCFIEYFLLFNSQFHLSWVNDLGVALSSMKISSSLVFKSSTVERNLKWRLHSLYIRHVWEHFEFRNLDKRESALVEQFFLKFVTTFFCYRIYLNWR